MALTDQEIKLTVIPQSSIDVEVSDRRLEIQVGETIVKRFQLNILRQPLSGELSIVNHTFGKNTKIVEVGKQGPRGIQGEKGDAGLGTHFETFVITPINLLEKKVQLSSTVPDPSKSIVYVAGGIPQVFGIDFYVDRDTVRWEGLALETLLDVGSIVQVNFFA